jgi:hypothetical protein
VQHMLASLPPVEEQTRIVEMIAGGERVELAGANRVSALGGLFDSLLHNLMTGKARVREVGTEGDGWFAEFCLRRRRLVTPGFCSTRTR